MIATPVDFSPDSWPIIRPGVDSRYFSSFDRRGGNNDGFNGTYSFLYRDPDGSYVLFDAEGPGCLRTFWFTSETSGHGKLSLGKLKFYFDDEKTPRFELDANELYSGKHQPFVAPLVADNTVSTGGYVSWVPLPFSKHLKITSENRAFFHISQYDLFPVGTKMPTLEQAAAHLTAQFESAGRFLPKGLKAPLSHLHHGKGSIRSITFEPERPISKQQLQSGRIKIWWDDEKQPDVDCPLGMFFGIGLGEAKIEAIPFRVADGLYQNRLRMPYWRSYRLEITGASGQLWVDRTSKSYDGRWAGYLSARFNEERPTSLGRDFEFLVAQGAGKLIGTVQVVEPGDGKNTHWWEGDRRAYVNGVRQPTMHGTGHEDDHLGGWSNEFLDAPFTLPMHGEPVVEMIVHSDLFNGNCSMYRFFPGVNFMGGAAYSVEHGTENRHNYDFAGTTFFYRLPGVDLVLLDRIDASLFVADSLTEVISAFEGRNYKRQLAKKFAYLKEPVSFSMDVGFATEGAYLRRMYDQEFGPQCADVLVDGAVVGRWYTAESNPHLRFGEREFFIPGSFLKGKRRIRVELRPTGQAPFSAAGFELYGIRRLEP